MEPSARDTDCQAVQSLHYYSLKQFPYIAKHVLLAEKKKILDSSSCEQLKVTSN